jgi:hypothetical protein
VRSQYHILSWVYPRLLWNPNVHSLLYNNPPLKHYEPSASSPHLHISNPEGAIQDWVLHLCFGLRSSEVCLFLLKWYTLLRSHFRLACRMPDESRPWFDDSIYENINYYVPLFTLPYLPLNKSVDSNVLLSTQPENPVCACMIPLRLGDHVLQKWKKTRQIYKFRCVFICTFFENRMTNILNWIILTTYSSNLFL